MSSEEQVKNMMGKKYVIVEIVCPNCKGEDEHCPLCDGTGRWYIWKKK